MDAALTVTVDEVLFRSDDGRYCVLRASDELTAHGDPVVLVGDLCNVAIGETLRVRGRYEQHRSYGMRFRVDSATPITPRTAAGIARYLGSGLITGIGPALAQRLVERFGETTLDVITTQSARLREVPGIGGQRAQAIAAAVRARLQDAEVMSFLQGLGLGSALAQRVRRRYGDDAVRVVREDPYLVAEQVSGVGFRTADAVAQALGYGRDDPRRAAGAILHLIGQAADEGHCYVALAELRRRAAALGVPDERLDPALRDLAARDLVRVDGSSLYAPPLYFAEVEVAERFRALGTRKRSRVDAEAAVKGALPAHFADAQRQAVRATFEHGLLVITGGPGTGKTTTVRAIVAAQQAAHRRILLAAPTGRAAKRLSEASGADAQTVHRLLEWNPRTGTFNRNRDSPLEADVVLIDEASMLDLLLSQHLLEALPSTAALVLVGDADQLPPVAAGPVLRELIESGVAPVVRLHEVFRQAEASAIVRAAHDVLRGRKPTPTPTGTRGPGDLFIVRADQVEPLIRKLLDTLERMRDVYGLDPVRDVQVLTPMRRGPLGVEALNAVLQHRFNPAPTSLQDASPPHLALRPGDKVMQLRNDYEREIWNGDVGEVRRVDAGIVFVNLGGREQSYEPEAQTALALSYACTVHKVQGSEFPAVVIVLHKSQYRLLSRPLLYTALTRAKRLAVIIGDDTALSRAVGNAEQRRMNTRLAARLQHVL